MYSVPMFDRDKALKFAKMFISKTDFEGKLLYNDYKKKIMRLYRLNNSSMGFLMEKNDYGFSTDIKRFYTHK